MAYTNPFKIANGLILDFTVEAAGGSDAFLLQDGNGSITKLSSIPASRISSGGNLTEVTSSVLTISGTGVLLSNGTIQVKQAATGQSGYLSSTDWNTFNNKLGTTLTSANVFVGNGSNEATGVAITGDIGITNAGVVSISSGVIVNADVHATAAIAVSKLAALTPLLAVATDASGFITTVAGVTPTKVGYLSNVSSDIQGQFTTTNQRIVGLTTSSTLQAPGAGQNNYTIIWDNANSQWDLSPAGGGGTLVGPASSTDKAISRWNGTGGDALQDSGVIIDDSNNITGVTSITLALSGLHLLDTDASHDLIFVVGSDLTADRNLTITTGDSNRSITLSGDTTLSDWFDQSVKTTADPVFNSATLSNASGLHILDTDSSHDLIFTTGSNLTADRTLTINTGDVSRTVTINTSGTFYITGGTDVALADGGTGASLSDPNYDAVFVWDNTAELSRLAQLGTGLSYDTYTNTITSYASEPAWLLASGGILTGVNTITSNAANQLNFAGAWSVTGANKYHLKVAPTITGNVVNEVIAFEISPSLINDTVSKAALYINPTFTGTGRNFSIISASSSAMALFGTDTSLDGTSRIQISTDGGNNSGLRLTNTGAVTSYTEISLYNTSSDQGQLFLTNSGYSATAIRQRGLGFSNNATGGVSIVAANATGSITLTTGGVNASNNSMTIDGNGLFTFLARVRTGLTANTEFLSADYQGNSWTWADGTVPTQRFNYFREYTLNKTTTSATFTDAYNIYADDLVAGSGVTITRNWAAGFAGSVAIESQIFIGSLGVTPSHTAHVRGHAADTNIFLVEENGGANIFEIIEAAGVNKIGFFAAAPVAQQAGLTAITHTAPVTPDYAIQDLVQGVDITAGFGFATKDEGNTVLSVIKAMHDALKLYGLLT